MKFKNSENFSPKFVKYYFKYIENIDNEPIRLSRLYINIMLNNNEHTYYI